MAKQTYIIQHWYGAPTYIEAARRNVNEGYNPEKYGTDFNRVSVKKVETALRYLAGWRRQAKEQGFEVLYQTLIRDDAHYQIIATPDGYHCENVVAEGMMKDLDQAA